MLGAGVADQDVAGLNVVTAAAIGAALVDAVDVVDAAADGESFNDTDAHGDWFVLVEWGVRVGSESRLLKGELRRPKALLLVFRSFCRGCILRISPVILF